MNKKRGSVTQSIRHLIQFAAFLLFPGLFITVLSAVRDILTACMGGISIVRLLPQIVLVIMVFLITALWGRFFCGFLCSFGMLQELLFFFSKRTILGKVRIPERLDHVMKSLKYIILAFIVAGVWILALPIDSSWNPWGVFGMLVSGNLSVVSLAIPTLGSALLLAILISSLFVGRFFCRYLCPLGALFTLVSGKRLYKIKRHSASCINCGLCTRACGMGINIPERDAVASGECIQCLQCLDSCPKESLSASPGGAIAGTAAAAAIGSTVIVANLIPFPVTETISEQQIAEKTGNGNYKDGIYTGAGKGFRGTTEVQVTVENGYIADITVLSFQDDKEFFGKAQSAVINAILTGQTPDVSPVSGATFSSNGIMDAVADALAGIAGGPRQFDGQSNNESKEDGSEQPGDDNVGDGAGQSDNSGMVSEPSDSGQKSASASGRFAIADGTYEGTGDGFRGATSVSVTVENGMITDITIRSYEDDDAFFTRAQDTVINEIINTQSLDVQTVSGATFSSNSIMDAVADALGNRSGEPEPSVGGGNGDGNGQQGGGDGSGNGNGQQGSGDGHGPGQQGGGNGRGWRGGSGTGRRKGRQH